MGLYGHNATVIGAAVIDDVVSIGGRSGSIQFDGNVLAPGHRSYFVPHDNLAETSTLVAGSVGDDQNIVGRGIRIAAVKIELAGAVVKREGERPASTVIGRVVIQAGG